MCAFGRFCLICSALLLTAHRLPAPIAEESSTPVPEQSAKPKPKRAKTASESSKSSTQRQTPSPQPKSESTLNPAPFAGTWIGILNWGIGGNAEHTIVIDAAQKTVSVTNLESGPVFPASINGNGICWTTGPLGQHRWLLKPYPDGKTALVT